MVAPLIIGAARLAAAALAKQAAKKSGKEVAKKAAVEAAKKKPMLRKKEESLPDSETNARAERSPEDYTPKMLKSTESKAMQQKYKYEKDLTQADKKANYNRAMKEDKANRASTKKSSSGYDGVRFDDSEYPF